METINNVQEGKNLVEVPFKIKDIIYTVYIDESDWADSRICIDAFEVKSVTIENNNFIVTTTGEAYWKGNLEYIKSDKFTNIGEATKKAEELLNKYLTRKKYENGE